MKAPNKFLLVLSNNMEYRVTKEGVGLQSMVHFQDESYVEKGIRKGSIN